MAEVKVIGASLSLFCTRIEWALKLKGVEYEYIEEDLKNKSLILVNSNPVHKKVPVLLHRDKPICESLLILEYIDEVWKDNPLLPQDPYQKAIARFWAKFADEKCVMGAVGACQAEGEEKEKAVESAAESFAFLEKQLQGNKYFGGEEIGFLDLALGWIPHWLNVMEEIGDMKLVDADNFPLLHQWAHRFIQLPLIKGCLPPRENLVNYFTASLTHMRSFTENFFVCRKKNLILSRACKIWSEIGLSTVSFWWFFFSLSCTIVFPLVFYSFLKNK